MSKDYIIEQLENQFKEKESFLREELFDFYRQFEPDLKDNTFRWRIYNLKTEKIITPLSRGLFTLSYKPVFIPEIGDVEKRIFTKVAKQFPGLRQCIWSTKAINEFMLHIPGRYITVLQVEKEALEPVYEFLKEQKYSNVYIQPEEKEIERYIYESDTAIILQSLITKSPTQRIKTITSITIEKMIVDLYSEKKLYNAFQGSELVHIINNAYNRYSIDFTKLFGYAKRRRKEVGLEEFLSTKTDIPKSTLTKTNCCMYP